MPSGGCIDAGLLVMAVVFSAVTWPLYRLLKQEEAPPLPEELPFQDELPFRRYSALLWFSTFDFIVTGVLMTLTACLYLFDFIDRKLKERRIRKLNQELANSLSRLRAWDARQEKLEREIKMVRSATADYELLQYLILRHQGRNPPSAAAAASY